MSNALYLTLNFLFALLELQKIMMVTIDSCSGIVLEMFIEFNVKFLNWVTGYLRYLYTFIRFTTQLRTWFFSRWVQWFFKFWKQYKILSSNPFIVNPTVYLRSRLKGFLKAKIIMTLFKRLEIKVFKLSFKLFYL